jgi:hypothetical protein
MNGYPLEDISASCFFLYGRFYVLAAVAMKNAVFWVFSRVALVSKGGT